MHTDGHRCQCEGICSITLLTSCCWAYSQTATRSTMRKLNSQVKPTSLHIPTQAGKEQPQHCTPVKSECIESPEPLKEASRSASSSAQDAPSRVRSSFSAGAPSGDSRSRSAVPVLYEGVTQQR